MPRKSYYLRVVRYCFALLLLIISSPGWAQPVQVQITPLQDYYYFSTRELQDGVNCHVLTNRKQMDKMFGKIDRPDTPDFSKELLLVMVMPKTKRQAKLSYKRSMMAGDFIEIYCDIDLKGHRLTYEYNPIAVAIIPRYKDIRKIEFYDQDHMRQLGAATLSDRL